MILVDAGWTPVRLADIVNIRLRLFNNISDGISFTRVIVTVFPSLCSKNHFSYPRK